MREPDQEGQEVTLGQIIFGLVVVVALIWTVILIIRWVISILPFILGLLVIYYFGRYLWRQMIRYSFTKSTNVILGLSMVAAILLTFLFARLFKIHSGPLNAIICGALFVLGATIALELRGYRYLQPSLSHLKELEAREKVISSKAEELRSEIGGIEASICNLEKKYSPYLEEEKHWYQKIEEECRTDKDMHKIRRDYESSYEKKNPNELESLLEGKTGLEEFVIRWLISKKRNEPIKRQIENEREPLIKRQKELQKELQEAESRLKAIKEERCKYEDESKRSASGSFAELRSEMKRDFSRLARASKRAFFTAYNGFLNLLKLWKSGS